MSGDMMAKGKGPSSDFRCLPDFRAILQRSDLPSVYDVGSLLTGEKRGAEALKIIAVVEESPEYRAIFGELCRQALDPEDGTPERIIPELKELFSAEVAGKDACLRIAESEEFLPWIRGAAKARGAHL